MLPRTGAYGASAPDLASDLGLVPAPGPEIKQKKAGGSPMLPRTGAYGASAPDLASDLGLVPAPGPEIKKKAGGSGGGSPMVLRTGPLR